MSIQLRKRNGHLWLSKYYIDEDNCVPDYRDIIVFFSFLCNKNKRASRFYSLYQTKIGRIFMFRTKEYKKILLKVSNLSNVLTLIIGGGTLSFRLGKEVNFHEGHK